MLQKWVSWVGKDHILRLHEAKAIVDILLGAMSITTGSRTWKSYLADLHERGQTEDRIKVVQDSLFHGMDMKEVESDNCLIQ